jgi:superfamily I DNA/RNA helicase
MDLPYDQLFEHVKLGDMILCRYNRYLVGACFRFIRNGVSVKIEGRAIGQGLVALCRKWKVKGLDTLRSRVAAWREREEKKALAKGRETKADEINDRAETVMVLIDRAQETGITTITGLTEMVMSLFDDNVVDKHNTITLCSAHRSKGLENPRIFILGLYELMGRQCRQDWQTQQELNLMYVSVTRAQELLVNVTGVREEKKREREAA